ncbi:MAG: NUDIX domain-containing protein [Candidatus Cloacimonetes bacterium]|nr:NUDIX domain-containing protein [Candidatus Cloacimonadota bacterium]
MALTKDSYKGINYCIRCGNELTILNDNEEKLRPHCVKCGWIYYKNPIPASACVIINEKKEVLIIKRKFDPGAGRWALPSGYIEINQNPDECAIEEMKEETGLNGEIIEFLGFYTDFSPLYEKVISFGFLMKVTGGELQAGDDAAEACYVAFDDCPEIVFPSHRYFLKKVIEKLSHEDLATD